MATNEYIKVSVITKEGGISIAKIDEENKLFYMAGEWIPSTDHDVLDKELRRNIKTIVHDNGKMYKDALRGLALPPTYQIND